MPRASGRHDPLYSRSRRQIREIPHHESTVADSPPADSAEDVFVFINTSGAAIAQYVVASTSDTLREIYPPSSTITHMPTNQRVTVTMPGYGIKILKQ